VSDNQVDRCLCWEVPFAFIREQVEAGALSSFEEIQDAFGCGTGCGMCAPYIRKMLYIYETEGRWQTTFQPGEAEEFEDPW